MLTFNLTDGTKFIKATEYWPIPSLNQLLLPGTKIQLKGKIKFVNQTLHLTADNIRVLGGTVPDISTTEYLIELLQNMM